MRLPQLTRWAGSVCACLGAVDRGLYLALRRPLLRDAGHDAYAIACTGLGDRVHLASQAIDLNTHIMDVVNTILVRYLLLATPRLAQ